MHIVVSFQFNSTTFFILEMLYSSKLVPKLSCHLNKFKLYVWWERAWWSKCIYAYFSRCVIYIVFSWLVQHILLFLYMRKWERTWFLWEGGKQKQLKFFLSCVTYLALFIYVNLFVFSRCLLDFVLDSWETVNRWRNCLFFHRKCTNIVWSSINLSFLRCNLIPFIVWPFYDIQQ